MENMKIFIKKLLREGLINDIVKPRLTEKVKYKKLTNILLMLEREIKVGDNLTKKLNSINSDLSKKLLAFFNSDKIKDNIDGEYVDYDKNNEKLFTLGYTDREGNKRTRLLKINKLLNYLGSSIEDIKDYEIEDLIGHLKKADTTQLREVTGDDILHAYHCANYDEGETMGSCMRFTAAQKYLELYTNNPSVISCLVLINPENNKVRGRAIIWTTTNGKRVMDRVYTTNKEYNVFFNNYAEEHNIDKNAYRYEVELEQTGEYDYYPYMDTFKFYTPDNGILSTEDGELELQDTNGGSTEANSVYSEYYGESIPEDEAIYSGHYEDWIKESEAVITWDDKIITINDAVRLDAGEHYDSWCLDSEAIEDYEGDWITHEEAYHLDAGEYTGHYALGDVTVDLYGSNGRALIEESVELTAGKYNGDWCLMEDAYVLLEGDDIYGIISDDDRMFNFKDLKMIPFKEFDENM